jgi:maltose O-acetyltransferase
MIGKILSYIYWLLNRNYLERTYELYRRKYRIHASFAFLDALTILNGPGEIELGPNSYIASSGFLYAYKDTLISVGANCCIASNVHLETGSYVADQDFADRANDKSLILQYGDIVIGDGCWIGKNVLIREGVTIGCNCVVGANSVVTHNLPPYSICVGAPAKPIKYKTSSGKMLKPQTE